MTYPPFTIYTQQFITVIQVMNSHIIFIREIKPWLIDAQTFTLQLQLYNMYFQILETLVIRLGKVYTRDGPSTVSYMLGL